MSIMPLIVSEILYRLEIVIVKSYSFSVCVVCGNDTFMRTQNQLLLHPLDSYHHMCVECKLYKSSSMCVYFNWQPCFHIHYDHSISNNLFAKKLLFYICNQRKFAKLAGQLQEIIFICTITLSVLFAVHCLTNFGAKFCSIREVLEVLFFLFLHLVCACHCLLVSEK